MSMRWVEYLAAVIAVVLAAWVTPFSAVAEAKLTDLNSEWRGSGTPAAIVKLLNQTINDGLKTKEMQEAIIRLGAVPKISSSEEFVKFIALQNKKWSAVTTTQQKFEFEL